MESRSSSVYSNERTGRGTYLDYSSSIGTASRTSSFRAARDYAESLSSASATPPHQYSQRAAPAQPAVSPRPMSTTPSSSRPSSARPSFMNYNNGAAAEELRRKPLPVAQPPPVEAPAPPRERTGQLLVFVGSEIQKSTLRFVEIAMQRKRFSGVAYVGFEEQAAALKQMKMDTYGIIGKLGLEAGVQIQYQQSHDAEAVKMAVEAVVKGAGDLQAVLCSLAYSTPGAAAANILDVESNGLQTAWTSSVGFLHVVARATIPAMIASSNATAQRPGFFLVQESGAQDPTSLLMQSSANALLRQLKETYASGSLNLNVGHAANVLIPLPEPMMTNGNDTASLQDHQAVPETCQPEPDLGGGESPTKLYSMWAMHESLGDF